MYGHTYRPLCHSLPQLAGTSTATCIVKTRFDQPRPASPRVCCQPRRPLFPYQPVTLAVEIQNTVPTHARGRCVAENFKSFFLSCDLNLIHEPRNAITNIRYVHMYSLGDIQARMPR